MKVVCAAAKICTPEILKRRNGLKTLSPDMFLRDCFHEILWASSPGLGFGVRV